MCDVGRNQIIESFSTLFFKMVTLSLFYYLKKQKNKNQNMQMIAECSLLTSGYTNEVSLELLPVQ